MTDTRTDQQRSDANKIQSVVTSLARCSHRNYKPLTDEHYQVLYRYAVDRSRPGDADVIAALGLPAVGTLAYKGTVAPSAGLDLSCLPAGVGHDAGDAVSSTPTG
jgi:hypothetical protein